MLFKSRKLIFAVLILALLCGLNIYFKPEISAQKQSEPQHLEKENLPVLPFNSLPAFIANVKSRLPRAGTEGFIKPTDADRETFSQAVLALLQGDLTNAANLANSVNYDLSQLNDQTVNKTYQVLVERNTNFRGLGTYIVDLNLRRNLVLEIPHPLYDVSTLEEGTTVFQQTSARGLFVTGTHRCANSQQSSCSGTTNACDGVNRPYRISDAAHYVENFFTSAHRATLDLTEKPVAISVHGHADDSLPEVVLSNGTDKKDSWNSLVNRLRRAVRNRGVNAGSCNFAQDARYSLCGGTNVQGRLSNGAANACIVNGNNVSGLFLHIEQRINIRNNPQPLIVALIEVIPVTQ